MAQLRERAALGVLDLKLSRALLVAGGIAGACLVERVGDRAHIEESLGRYLGAATGGGRVLAKKSWPRGRGRVQRLSRRCA